MTMPPYGGRASGNASRASRCTPADPDDATVAADIYGATTSWNPPAEKLFGYPAVAAVGQSLSLIVPPKHLLGHETRFHRAMDATCLANGDRPSRPPPRTVASCC